jgi:hypothetical protein
MNYIYILQEREYKNTKIYKIGKTKQENLKRIRDYSKCTELMLQTNCFDCDKLERTIIELFKKKYILKEDIGAEYFEGDIYEMKTDIFNECQQDLKLNKNNNERISILKHIDYNKRYDTIIKNLNKITSKNIKEKYFDTLLYNKYIDIGLHMFINDYYNNINSNKCQYINVGLYMDSLYKINIMNICHDDIKYNKLINI